jgi:repressor LexA
MRRKFQHHNLNSTEKMEEALKFIDSFIKENGYSPSVREIAEMMGVPSSSTIAGMIATMQRFGYIEPPKQVSKNGNRIARAIKISEKGRQLLG